MNDEQQHSVQDTWVSPSGAKSSTKLPGYHRIPWNIFAKRLAERYRVGVEDKGYGEDNWRKGLEDPVFIIDRCNHFLDHAHRLVEEIRTGVKTGDDDAAAAMWAIIALMAVQEKRDGHV